MKSNNDPVAAYTQLLLRSLDGEKAELPASKEQASIPDCADGVLNVFRRLCGNNLRIGIDGSSILTERAKILGLKNPGPVSANGSCRLLKTRSGWIALNLARADDWHLMPAWLATEANVGDWQSIELLLGSRSGSDLVERGRLMGIPVTGLASFHADHWFSSQTNATPAPASARKSSPVVVDLSSLWAGPLCSHLLYSIGATVIKVESSSRPDSTRFSSPDFHNLINGGKYSVVLDLNEPREIQKLEKLMCQADIVIESSRPRALRQLGIDAEKMIEQTPGLTWVNITGYGRTVPQTNWVAFGDDAAVAAGATISHDGIPAFVGDAVSDPLTGMHAAVAALASWQRGGGSLIDISLAGVTSFIMQYIGSASAIDLESDSEPRRSSSIASALGADTGVVFSKFIAPCC